MFATMRKRCSHLRRKEAKLREKGLSRKWKKRSRGYTAWRLLKGIVCVVCLALFFYQSAEFLQLYYKYPTKTKVEFTYPKWFEFPAVTFCNQNHVRRSKFCAEYPDLCERPLNITRACGIEPSSCMGNTSNFVIPKLGYLTSNSYVDVYRAIPGIYFSGNTTKEFWEEWTWRIEKEEHDTERKMKPAFVPLPNGLYFPCFVENLLLNSTDEPEKMNLDWKRTIGHFHLNLPRSEEFYFGMEPSVLFSIHSPFVPANTRVQGSVLELGNNYKIYVKLEEEILMPFPYATDCTIYEDSWNEGNPDRPRSQEMCEELCLHNVSKRYKDMQLNFKMMNYPIPFELCYAPNCKTSKGNEILEQCRRNCKPSCRILKYTSTIQTSVYKTKPVYFDEPDPDREKIDVRIYLTDRQVVVNRHFALYDTGDLFSYIGGLMGCWLGISIWAFAGIAERVVRKALQWMEQIKRYLKNTSQAPQTVFVPHRINVLEIKNV